MQEVIFLISLVKEYLLQGSALTYNEARTIFSEDSPSYLAFMSAIRSLTRPSKKSKMCTLGAIVSIIASKEFNVNLANKMHLKY